MPIKQFDGYDTGGEGWRGTEGCQRIQEHKHVQQELRLKQINVDDDGCGTEEKIENTTEWLQNKINLIEIYDEILTTQSLFSSLSRFRLLYCSLLHMAECEWVAECVHDHLTAPKLRRWC